VSTMGNLFEPEYINVGSTVSSTASDIIRDAFKKVNNSLRKITDASKYLQKTNLTFYVSPQTNVNNDGLTIGSPISFSQLESALTNIDTSKINLQIYLAEGVYTSSLTLLKIIAQKITISPNLNSDPSHIQLLLNSTPCISLVGTSKVLLDSLTFDCAGYEPMPLMDRGLGENSIRSYIYTEQNKVVLKDCVFKTLPTSASQLAHIYLRDTSTLLYEGTTTVESGSQCHVFSENSYIQDNLGSQQPTNFVIDGTYVNFFKLVGYSKISFSNNVGVTGTAGGALISQDPTCFTSGLSPFYAILSTENTISWYLASSTAATPPVNSQSGAIATTEWVDATLTTRINTLEALINQLVGQSIDIPIVPPAFIGYTAASSAPGGWLLCRGQAVSRTLYAALFTAIGTTYGEGDGLTTFNIPNIQGRTVLGVNPPVASRNMNVATYSLGNTGGREVIRLTKEQLAEHTHAVAVEPHTHDIIDNGHEHLIVDDGHAHSITAYSGTGNSFIGTGNNSTGMSTATSTTQPTITGIDSTELSRSNLTETEALVSIELEPVGVNAPINILSPFITLNPIIKF